jgi:hypothetical protein
LPSLLVRREDRLRAFSDFFSTNCDHQAWNYRLAGAHFCGNAEGIEAVSGDESDRFPCYLGNLASEMVPSASFMQQAEKALPRPRCDSSFTLKMRVLSKRTG